MPPAMPADHDRCPVGAPRRVVDRADALDRDAALFVGVNSRRRSSTRLSPCSNEMNASFLPSGDQEPDALTKLSASKCGSALGPVSFFTTWPVFASATKRSIVNRPRRAKNATHLPSGLIAGATFISPGSFGLPMQRLTDVGGLGAAFHERQVRRANRRQPLLRQRIARDADHTTQCRVPPAAQRRAIDIAHALIAPLSADVRPQRLAVAVREVARIGRELLDGGQVVAQRPRRASTSRCADPRGRPTGTRPCLR